MRKRVFFNCIWGTMMFCSGLVSCSDENNDGNGGGDIVPPPSSETNANRLGYILNEGLWGGNNSSLSRYSVDSTEQYVADCYQVANDKLMGDLAQDLKAYDNRLYVVVSGSKYIAKLDKQGKELARYAFTTEQGEPRTLVPVGEYLYVTSYDGAVHRFDTLSLSHQGSLMVAEGMRLEGMTVCNGKLYVAIGYQVIPATSSDSWDIYDYQDRLAVVDVATFKKEKEITVRENPSVLDVLDGEVYLYSIGDYATSGALIQRVHADGTVDSIAVANKMAVADGRLLLVNAVTEYGADYTSSTKNELMQYDAVTGLLSKENFLPEAPNELFSSVIYLLVSDPVTGDIYVGTTDYVSTGTVYRFTVDGNYVGKFDCGGVNPSKMVFLN